MEGWTCVEMRTVLTRPDGFQTAAWQNNVAISYILGLFYRAGFTKQRTEATLLAQLRHQGVDAMAVEIQDWALVQTTRNKQGVNIHWYCSDTVEVYRVHDIVQIQPDPVRIWAGAPPLPTGSVEFPCFCITIKLELCANRTAADVAKRREPENVVKVHAVRVLRDGETSIKGWIQGAEGAERGFVIFEATNDMNNALHDTEDVHGGKVWDSTQNHSELSGWWMIGTASGFLRENSAILLAKDEMSARILAAMLFNSQQGRDDKGPTQLFPWTRDPNDEQAVPEGWATAEITVGMAVISGGTMVGFEADNADAPLTLRESLENHLLLPDHIDEDGWRGLTLAFVVYWRTNYAMDTVCGMCQRKGEGSTISESSAMCKQCWGTVMALATHGYTAEDLVNLKADCDREERATTCLECGEAEVVFGTVGFDEAPFMCGACRMRWAGDELDKGVCERDTGFDLALLQNEQFLDERWRMSLRALAKFRQVRLIEDGDMLGFENPVSRADAEVDDGGAMVQRQHGKKQRRRPTAEIEVVAATADAGLETNLLDASGADEASKEGEGARKEKSKKKKKEKKMSNDAMELEAGRGDDAEAEEPDVEMDMEEGRGEGAETEGGFDATCSEANAARQRGAGGHVRPSLDEGYSYFTPPGNAGGAG